MVRGLLAIVGIMKLLVVADVKVGRIYRYILALSSSIVRVAEYWKSRSRLTSSLLSGRKSLSNSAASSESEGGSTGIYNCLRRSILPTVIKLAQS